MTDLVKLTQEPIIETKGLTEIADAIQIEVEAMNVDSLVATAENLSEIKKILTRLNRLYNDAEDARKLLKKQIMAPYDAFMEEYDSKIKGYILPVKEKLGSKYKGVENTLMQAKTEALQEYFREESESRKIDFIQWQTLNLKFTRSTSDNSIKEQIKTFLDDVANSLKAIDSLQESEEYKTDVMVEYKSTLNFQKSLVLVNNKIAERQRLLKAKEEREKARLEAEEARKAKEAEKANQPAPETPAPQPRPEQPKPEQTRPEQPEEVIRVEFTVEGKISDLRALKEFMSNNNIKIIE